jgi:hypothetical protein
MTKTQFKTALWASMLVGMLGLVASFAGESGLPEPLRQHLEERRNAELSAIDWVLFGVGLPLIVVEVAAFIGMLRFAPWSRPLWIGVSVVGLLTLPLLGPTVEPGLTTALFHVSSMSSGAIAAVAYSSPTASAWFAGSRPNQPLQPTSGAGTEVE